MVYKRVEQQRIVAPKFIFGLEQGPSTGVFVEELSESGLADFDNRKDFPQPDF